FFMASSKTACTSQRTAVDGDRWILAAAAPMRKPSWRLATIPKMHSWRNFSMKTAFYLPRVWIAQLARSVITLSKIRQNLLKQLAGPDHQCGQRPLGGRRQRQNTAHARSNDTAALQVILGITYSDSMPGSNRIALAFRSKLHNRSHGVYLERNRGLQPHIGQARFNHHAQ